MHLHLKELEQESIEIIRKTYADSIKPVVLYSIGKDSSVLLQLFKKAFYPNQVPVEFLHIDTTWKFKEMINFRDKLMQQENLNYKIFTNQEGVKKNINPFDHDFYTDTMKTEALKEALNVGKYDFIYGGARRDEEKSRSKERIVSQRDKNHTWNPKNQRIEPWNIFNTKHVVNHSFRIFPLSNWTELNIWEYIKQEKIDIVPLYFAKKRKVVEKLTGEIFLLDDDRYKFQKGDKISELVVRFRTLGCYPLTAAIKSEAVNLDQIIEEVSSAKYSERYGRVIDYDTEASMELKKKQGYF